MESPQFAGGGAWVLAG